MKSVIKKFMGVKVPIPVPLLLAVIVVLAAGIFAKCVVGTKPFRDLSASDIEMAGVEVKLTGLGTSMNEDEIRELTELLHSVTVYEKTELDKAFYEQSVKFDVWTSDGSGVGTDIIIRNNPPYIEINGQGYRTKKEPSENLKTFAYRLTEDIE